MVSEKASNYDDEPPIFVAAMEKGPGPGKYNLGRLVGTEDHDFTMTKCPAYSIGLKSDWRICELSPGPIYNTVGLTCHGSDAKKLPCSHSWRNCPFRSYKAPGPSDYRSEDSTPIIKSKAPAYSMGLRAKLFKKSCYPAADEYHLPNFIPKYNAGNKTIPGFTMARKGELPMYQQSPGPAAYPAVSSTVNKTCPPAFTVREKVFPNQDLTPRPGPNTYITENVKINKVSAPAFSMGIRHSDFTFSLITNADRQ